MSDKFTGDAVRMADAGLENDNNPLSNWTDPANKVSKSRMASEDLDNTVKREQLGDEQSFLLNNGNINGPVLPNIDIEPKVEEVTPAAVPKKKAAATKPEKTPKAGKKK